MKKIYLVKLGGSVITEKDKEYAFKPQVVKRLAREIKKSGKQVVIAHGSGSFGHTSAKKHGGMNGYKTTWGIAKVSYDAMKINSLIMDVLINEKIPAVSFRPASMILASKSKVSKVLFEPILEALQQGLIPVIYGDVIWDKTQKSTIYSGEKILGLLADFLLKQGVKINKIIEVGITNGVYDENGKTINEINKKNFKIIKKLIYKNKNDVTGGMEHKIEEALKIASKNVVTLIINGGRKNELLKVLKNQNSSFSTLIK